LEERQARIEGILEQMDKRLSAVESAVRILDSEIKALRTELSNEISRVRTELTSKIDSSFKWLVGIILTMWVTIILTILVKT